MKTYFIDTNVFIRYLLRDNEEMYQEVCNFFAAAQKKKHRLILLDVILLEIEYVLRKVYQVPKELIYRSLLNIIHLEQVEINNRDVLAQSIDAYKNLTLDLVDIMLHFAAREKSAEVFSFDQGFKKFKKAL